jgi:hypothetical protein
MTEALHVEGLFVLLGVVVAVVVAAPAVFVFSPLMAVLEVIVPPPIATVF